MHKGFYASGFLYNPGTEQILLQQLTSSPTPTWTLFETTYTTDDAAENVFIQTIKNILDIQLKQVYPIYSYVNDILGKNQDVFYAICNDALSFLPKNDCHFRWFSFKEVIKLTLDEQIRHDIIVGKRVIEAVGRQQRGEHTFI